MAQQTLSVLFEKEPSHWGLRGDPLLWQEIAQRIGQHPLPATETLLSELLENTFERLVGYPITHQSDTFVEKYAQGGLSSGYVCLAFWRETAFPMLKARYAELGEGTHTRIGNSHD